MDHLVGRSDQFAVATGEDEAQFGSFGFGFGEGRAMEDSHFVDGHALGLGGLGGRRVRRWVGRIRLGVRVVGRVGWIPSPGGLVLVGWIVGVGHGEGSGGNLD